MSAIDELTPVPSQPEISEGNKTFSQKTYALYVWIRTKLIPAMIEMRDTIRNFVSSAYTSSSTTSLTIGVGNKTLSVGPGRSYQVGNPLRIAYITDPTKYMDGVAVSYNTSTGDLVVNVLAINGSGTFASWNIFMIPSATGLASLGANKFTGKQVFSNPITVAPSSSLDLTSYDSNQFLFDGSTATITSVSLNLGAVVKIRVGATAAGTVIQNGAGLSVQGNDNYTCESGDVLTLIKQDATTIVEISKQSGRPVVGVTLNTTNDPSTNSSSGLDYVTPQWVRALALIKNGNSVSTSGAVAYDFSIPAGVKRVSVIFDGVSTVGTSQVCVRLGTTAGVLTSGYNSSAWTSDNGKGENGTALLLEAIGSAGFLRRGCMTINMVQSDLWVSSHTYGQTINSGSSGSGSFGGGSVQLPGQLTTLRVTTLAGSENFDGGTVTVLLEF